MTKTLKKIEAILPRPLNYGMVGDGFRVYNYFPNGYRIRDFISPFLMLDYNPPFDFGPSNHPRGVDVHPHKGFETVTIAYKGSVAHHDSKGNSGVINPGDVQWMTAGGGILHKEYHEKEFSKKGGAFEMVQLWVNLPKKDKLVEPHYQGIEAKDMGKLVLENNGGQVNVIAGEINGVKGAAKTFTEINLFDIRITEGAALDFEIKTTHNCAILVIEGEAEINEKRTKQHEFVLFAHEGETIRIKANEKSILLLLSGVPINEPIAQYGPFVMNTKEELNVAFEEFNSGKFGVLE
jgi:redox-sensitive bicupin YhaK (pirin superfamily)